MTKADIYRQIGMHLLDKWFGLRTELKSRFIKTHHRTMKGYEAEVYYREAVSLLDEADELDGQQLRKDIVLRYQYDLTAD